MHKQTGKLTLALMLTFAFSAYSHAAMLNNVTDHGSYFSEGSAGLDWLDLSVTTGLGYSTVTSKLEEGGELEGWRYATTDEFIFMVEATTGITTSISHTGQKFEHENELYAGLIELLGSTLDISHMLTFGEDYDTLNRSKYGDDYENLDYAYGLLAPTTDDPRGKTRGLIIDDDRSIDYLDSITLDYTTATLLNPWYLGSYLVRDTRIVADIPTPATLPLLLIGLLTVLFLQHLSRRKVL